MQLIGIERRHWVCAVPSGKGRLAMEHHGVWAGGGDAECCGDDISHGWRARFVARISSQPPGKSSLIHWIANGAANQADGSIVLTQSNSSSHRGRFVVS